MFCFRSQAEPENGFINLTAFYVVPNDSQKSSVLFNGYFSEKGYKTLPPPARAVFRLRPKWATHLFVHNVFDGDSKILRKHPAAPLTCCSVKVSMSMKDLAPFFCLSRCVRGFALPAPLLP